MATELENAKVLVQSWTHGKLPIMNGAVAQLVGFLIVEIERLQHLTAKFEERIAELEGAAD